MVVIMVCFVVVDRCRLMKLGLVILVVLMRFCVVGCVVRVVMICLVSWCGFVLSGFVSCIVMLYVMLLCVVIFGCFSVMVGVMNVVLVFFSVCVICLMLFVSRVLRVCLCVGSMLVEGFVGGGWKCWFVGMFFKCVF